jgi:hypothetical protein
VSRRTLVTLTVALVIAWLSMPGVVVHAAPDPFVPVFIDSKTEKALGPFPYDRALYAKAVDRARELGARGVVIKFFLDKPKSAGGDDLLARAMATIPTVLQARIDDEEKTPNPLPEQFRLPANLDAVGEPLAGNRGWIPLPKFAAVAHDIGFIDHRVMTRMPMIERYQSRYAKSLYLCCIEMASGQRAEIRPAESVRIGRKSVTLDRRSEVAVTYPIKDELSYIPFADFIAGSKPTLAVKDRVVVLAYDSERFEPVDTPMGKVRPHRAFYYALLSIYRQFEGN